MEDVLAVIRGNRAWDSRVINYDRGFEKLTWSRSWEEQRVEIGEKSISVSIGYDSGLIFGTRVYAHWGFNGDGELIDVWIWKSPNMP